MFSILFGRRNLHWHTPPNERIQYHPVSCWCYWRMAENIAVIVVFADERRNMTFQF